MNQDKLIPLKGLRGMIARNLSQAWQAPRVAQGVEVRVDRSQELVASLREHSGRKVTMTHLLIKALGITLREHPQLNATIDDEGIHLHDDVNIAVAIATEAGLLAPVMMQVQDMSIVEIVDALADLAGKARTGTLPAAAYQRGTFTISALGATGIDWFTPVLNPPQAGILGVGTIAERAIVVDGAVQAAPTMELTLVFDHRATDGYPAGQFLVALKQLIEDAGPLEA